MFTVNDEEFDYWPVSGLMEGDQTTPIVIKHVTPVNGELVATQDDRLIVWGRVSGTSTYYNLVEDPIDLSGLSGPDTEFDVYVEALTPVVGLERVPITVMAGESSTAGWVT